MTAARTGRWVLAGSWLAFAAIVISTWAGVWDGGFSVAADTKSYVDTARQLKGLPSIEAESGALRPPVYPLFLLAMGFPQSEADFVAVTLAQSALFILAGGLVAWALYAGWGSPWLASIPLWVLLFDARLVTRVNNPLSESVTVVLVLLLVAAGAAALRQSGARRTLALAGAGLLTAGVGLCRAQYLLAGVYLLPVALLLWRRDRTWRVGVMCAVLGAALPFAAWKAYLKTRPVVSREGRVAWVVFGKMIAPHFYTGPENSLVEQSVALMWNEAFRRGRTSAQFPRTEWLYVRQNFPEFQRAAPAAFGPGEWDTANFRDYDVGLFNATVKRLALRSVRHNGARIVGARFQALWKWITANDDFGFERRFRPMTMPRLARDVRHGEFLVLADGVACLNVIVNPNRTWVALAAALVLWVLFDRRRRGRDEWILVLGILCFVLGDLLFIGLLYQGYKPRFKTLDLPLLWIANGLMVYWLVREFVDRRRARQAAGH